MPSFGAIANTAYASRTNITISKPSGVADGDLMIALVALGANPFPPVPVAPAGWTAGVGGVTSVSLTETFGFNLVTRLYYKVASSEGASYAWTHGSASSAGWIVSLTGDIDSGSPFTPNATLNSGNGTTSTATGLTTARDDSTVIFWGVDYADLTNNLTPPSGSTPTFTERLDGVVVYVATGQVATAGATGSKSFTNNNNGANNNPWAAGLIAVQPTSAPPAVPYVRANYLRHPRAVIRRKERFSK